MARDKQPRGVAEQELLREWGKMLAEEIESLTVQGVQAIRQGHLQDALAEARVVLELAGHEDLARKAYDLLERLSEVRAGPRGVRVLTPVYESVRREARNLAGEIRRRMEEVALGTSKAHTG